MPKHLLLLLRAIPRSRRELTLENVALRHQFEVLQLNAKRPKLRPADGPQPRAVQDRDVGPIAGEPVQGGLHHRYYTKAA